MLWVILIVCVVGALAAVTAENNTRHLKAMILVLGADKQDLLAAIDDNRAKIDELQAEVFNLKMELRGVAR